jgi:hypothetical protein
MPNLTSRPKFKNHNFLGGGFGKIWSQNIGCFRCIKYGLLNILYSNTPKIYLKLFLICLLLSFTRMTLGAYQDCHTKINVSKYQKEFLLINDTLECSYSFNGSIFNKAIFDSSVFKKTVSFSHAEFNKKPSFYATKFLGQLNFFRSIFHDEAEIRFSSIKQGINFRKTHCYADAKFEATIFYEQCVFAENCFKGDVSFFNTRFPNRTRFIFNDFNSDVNFGRATIDSIFYFSYNSIGKNAIVDLSNVRYKKNTCWIDLTGTNISRINMRYKQFRLWFKEGEDVELIETTYLSLRSRLLELNYYEDYVRLDKEYQEWKYLEKDPENRKIGLNTLQKAWWGYGHNKNLIFRNTLILFVFFWVLNFFFFRKMSTQIYIIKDKVFKYDVFNRLLGSLFYSGIIFFGVYFSVSSLNSKSLEYKNIGWLMLLFCTYCTGLICIGFISNLIFTF